MKSKSEKIIEDLRELSDFLKNELEQKTKLKFSIYHQNITDPKKIAAGHVKSTIYPKLLDVKDESTTKLENSRRTTGIAIVNDEKAKETQVMFYVEHNPEFAKKVFKTNLNENPEILVNEFLKLSRKKYDSLDLTIDQNSGETLRIMFYENSHLFGSTKDYHGSTKLKTVAIARIRNMIKNYGNPNKQGTGKNKSKARLAGYYFSLLIPIGKSIGYSNVLEKKKEIKLLIPSLINLNKLLLPKNYHKLDLLCANAVRTTLRVDSKQRQVLKRYQPNIACSISGKKEKVEAAHLRPTHKGGFSKKNNLIWLDFKIHRFIDSTLKSDIYIDSKKKMLYVNGPLEPSIKKYIPSEIQECFIRQKRRKKIYLETIASQIEHLFEIE